MVFKLCYFLKKSERGEKLIGFAYIYLLLASEPLAYNYDIEKENLCNDKKRFLRVGVLPEKTS